jgi:REP element-mobilizing transposase RayT
MRAEPYGTGSILHIVKPGARGMEIVRDTSDHRRFLNSLYFLNEKFKGDIWEREIDSLPGYLRPNGWPERKPLTNLLAWTLLPNHLHLIIQVREDRETGVTEFMQTSKFYSENSPMKKVALIYSSSQRAISNRKAHSYTQCTHHRANHTGKSKHARRRHCSIWCTYSRSDRRFAFCANPQGACGRWPSIHQSPCRRWH